MNTIPQELFERRKKLFLFSNPQKTLEIILLMDSIVYRKTTRQQETAGQDERRSIMHIMEELLF